MLLSKTDKARTALRERQGGLSAAERRALILCDGRRGLDELTRMLGPAILAALDRLRVQGYLEASPPPPPLAARVRGAARELIGAAGGPPAAPAEPVARSPAPPRPQPPSRRSLAATKMYMLDMLQLQRSAEAAELRAAIQAAAGDDAVVEQVLRAFAHIRRRANASYAARVGERLAEVLPEAHLPRLAEMRAPAADSTAA